MALERLRRVPWEALAIEGFAVFLSVLVAFAVAAWIERRDEAELRRTALANFAAEMGRNRAALAERQPYHERLAEALDDALERPGPRPLDSLLAEAGFEGARPFRPRTTAMLAAEATDALALVDFQTAGAIAAVYDLQRRIDELNRTSQAAILNPATLGEADGRPGARVTEVYFEFVAELETELLAAYSEVIPALERRAGAPARSR